MDETHRLTDKTSNPASFTVVLAENAALAIETFAFRKHGAANLATVEAAKVTTSQGVN